MALGEILTGRWDPLQFLGFCISFIRRLGMERLSEMDGRDEVW